LVQSISKLFALSLALADGEGRLRQRVGREPSDSLVQLEVERGIPRNPSINAGAIVITGLRGRTKAQAAWNQAVARWPRFFAHWTWITLRPPGLVTRTTSTV
jgi:glutaminase